MATQTPPLPNPELLIQYGAIGDAIASVAAPKGVRLRALRLDADYTGEPSIFATFAVSKRIELTDAFVREMNQFKHAVMDAIDRLNVGRIPYVIFE